MPALSSTAKAARALACVLTLLAGPLARGQDAPPPDVDNSALDAPLFYQLLLGELELQSGQAGNAYQLMLDAARKQPSEALFRRAAEIALQARAGDQALVAIRAWRSALPQSLEACQFEVQLLTALNRVAEMADPLQELLKRTPTGELPSVISALPRLLSRSSDQALAARVVEEALRPWLGLPETRTAAGVAIGRMQLAAGNAPRALEFAKRAQSEDPASDAPALLALELMPRLPQAEALVGARLQGGPPSTGLRLVYVQVLTTAQRFVDAIAQLEQVARDEPARANTWLTLGALHLELRRPDEAKVALQHYLALAQAPAASAAEPDPQQAGHPDTDGITITVAPREDGETSAYLMLAQAAEAQRDYGAAEAWLDKVKSPQRALEVQSRRASLLARQGRVDDARRLIQQVPARNEADTRAKLLAEAHLLREARQWPDARAVLAEANRQYPDDVSLLYEQAMVEEKLDRLDEMERLLQRVIELKPDHHHAYNALGYSLAERNVRLPQARTLIRKALDLAPGDPFITDSMGWVAYRQGHLDEALQLLRSAYQSRPDPEIAAHLGEVLWVDGQHEEARRIWREARSRDADNDVLRETLARLRVDL